MPRRLAILAVVLAMVLASVVVATTASAAGTGSISGVVADPVGCPSRALTCCFLSAVSGLRFIGDCSSGGDIAPQSALTCIASYAQPYSPQPSVVRDDLE